MPLFQQLMLTDALIFCLAGLTSLATYTDSWDREYGNRVTIERLDNVHNIAKPVALWSGALLLAGFILWALFEIWS